MKREELPQLFDLRGFFHYNKEKETP